LFKHTTDTAEDLQINERHPPFKSLVLTLSQNSITTAGLAPILGGTNVAGFIGSYSGISTRVSGSPEDATDPNAAFWSSAGVQSAQAAGSADMANDGSEQNEMIRPWW
jgi:hypothetical protein